MSQTEARRAYKAAWAAANREKLQAYHRARYKAHREEVKAQARAWAENNPERDKATRQAWYAANREKHAAASAEWAKNNREESRAIKAGWEAAHAAEIAAKRAANPERKAYGRKYRQANYAMTLWTNAKHRAVRKGKPFDMTVAQVAAMLVATPVCPVFGITLAPGRGRDLSTSPSLDCYKPDLGYVTGNVFVISHRANELKRDGTTDEIRQLLAWMTATDTTVGKI